MEVPTKQVCRSLPLVSVVVIASCLSGVCSRSRSDSAQCPGRQSTLVERKRGLAGDLGASCCASTPAVSGRMSAPPRVVTRAEVPQKWWDAERKPVPDSARELLGLPAGTEISARVALELPDYPICRAWMKWYHSQPLTDDVVAVTMTSQAMERPCARWY